MIINKISLIHPSRNRPEMAAHAITNWLNKMYRVCDWEYILSIDEDEPNKVEYAAVECISPFIKTLVSPNQTAIEAINNAAKVSTGDLIIVVSDDFDCHNGWDKWLIDNLNGGQDYLVKTFDGIQDWLITLPIMDRTYYERFGYIYYPEYKHMFCDTEMTEVGHLLGKVIDLKDASHPFLHKHYSAGYMAKDSINEKNDNTWGQGEALFNIRKSHGFFVNQ